MNIMYLCHTCHWCIALKEHDLIDVSECEDKVHQVWQGQGLEVEEGVITELGAIEDKESHDATDKATKHNKWHDHQIGDTLEDVINTRLWKSHVILFRLVNIQCVAI